MGMKERQKKESQRRETQMGKKERQKKGSQRRLKERLKWSLLGHQGRRDLRRLETYACYRLKFYSLKAIQHI